MSSKFATRVGLPQSVRTAIVKLLNQQLADSSDLHSQIKQAHWNVKGMHFIQLHLLFDKLAGEMDAVVDQIAERATALGGAAQGTARMAASASRIPEFPAGGHNGPAAVELLAVRFASLAVSTRTAIATADKAEDPGTSDMFTGISRGLDSSLWFLEAHLQA